MALEFGMKMGYAVSGVLVLDPFDALQVDGKFRAAVTDDQHALAPGLGVADFVVEVWSGLGEVGEDQFGVLDELMDLL